MRDQLCPVTPTQVDLSSHIQQCLRVEQGRNLADTSLKELKRYLAEFAQYCKEHDVRSPSDLSPVLLKDYAEHRCHDSGPGVKKAVVWSLRKFGKFLHLLQLVKDNPAKHLRHPKFHPRSKLPEYLSESALRKLLINSAAHGTSQEFVILSLMNATGLRPNEICLLKRSDVHLKAHYMDVSAKGGWIKKTPLSSSMATILKKYLSTITDKSSVCFVNKRGFPITVSWLQRMVKGAGKRAGIPLSLTCNHLRHTFATYAADMHGKVLTKALMGHQNLSTTEIYTHLSPRHFRPLMKYHPYNDKERSL